MYFKNKQGGLSKDIQIGRVTIWRYFSLLDPGYQLLGKKIYLND